ncbi:hypothetical protein PtB15_6B29 [Puccinia triticina]|nr:hypothetical protein PtB15_6B29 [Puccinia triticina]
MAKISSSLPPVGESFNHLGLASISSPTEKNGLDHPSCSSAHSSGHGFKHQLDHPSQTLLDQWMGIEYSQAGSVFSSPCHHSRRASSFDFPEILSNFPEEEIDLVKQIYGKSKAGLDSHQTIDDDVMYPIACVD